MISFRCVVFFTTESTATKLPAISPQLPSTAILRKQYKQLPYIVYKSKYLVPQKPTKPYSMYSLFKSEYKTQYIDNKSFGPTIAYKSLPFQKKIELQKRVALNTNEYLKKMAQYQEKYINPPNYKSLTGLSLYKKQLIARDQYKKINFTESGYLWNQLSQQQKQKYKTSAILKKQQKREPFLLYEKKHLIPNLKVYYDGVINNYFTKPKSLGVQKAKELFQVYHKLPQQKKKLYIKLAIQNNIDYKANYDKFLKKWNLTQQSLQNILKVCSMLEQNKKTRRLIKKPIQNVNNDKKELENKNNQKQINNQTLVNKL